MTSYICRSNALAETINGRFKTELINRANLANRRKVELATAEWVDWLNHRRLEEHSGDVRPPTSYTLKPVQRIAELSQR